MNDENKSVFICYRRTNLPWALAIYQYLTQKGYDVFFDYVSIDSGDFEKIIFENIRVRAHFLVILTPSALERCNDPNDWFRREIEFALDANKNIVPLLMDSFEFDMPSVEKQLNSKLAQLALYNGLRVPAAYFAEAMARLDERFLKVSTHPIIPTQVEEIQSKRLLKVFLCHAFQDKAIVRGFYARLTEDGFDAWLDEENILPGQDWDFEIEKAIESSDAIIIFLSKHSVNKEGYIQKEIRYIYEIALEKPEGTIFIIPARLDDCQVPRRVHHYHFEDLFPSDRIDNAYKRIRKSLKLKELSISGDI